MFWYFGMIIHILVTCILTFHLVLFSDSDLHMAALALELCCTLMADKRSGPNVGLTVRNKVLPQALTLVRSALLQGQALLVSILCFTHWNTPKNLIFTITCSLVIPGTTELLWCTGLLCKHKLWCAAGLSSFNCKTTCPSWSCGKTGFIFNCPVCCCSLPCGRASKVFYYCKYAYRYPESW